LKFEIKEREEKIMANQNPYIVIEQKEESKKRTWVAVVLAVAFVAILGIGGTFAYLTWTTNQTPNRFTTDPTITADLLEPTWTKGAKASATEAGQATPDETKVGKASDGEYIPIEADNMLPSSVVAKNPFVVNTSNNGADIYAGMKLQFQKWVVDKEGGTGQYVNMNAQEVGYLLSCYGFLDDEGDENSKAGIASTDNPLGEGWTQINRDMAGDYGATEGTANNDGAMYFYNTEVIKAETSGEAGDENTTSDYWNIPSTKRTSSLFTHVRFINNAKQSDINRLNDVLKMGKGLSGKNYATDPGWRVVISGAAIQATDDATADEFVASTLQENWKTLLDANTLTTDPGDGSKPTAPTGVRSALTTYFPEASNIKPDGTEVSGS
jgi:predicted ribosomally synthesized peptide with SipW-like signal peptide